MSSFAKPTGERSRSDRLSRNSIPKILLRAFPIALCAALLALSTGCASSPLADSGTRAIAPPHVSAPPPAGMPSPARIAVSKTASPSWAESTRDGRRALRARDFEGAETHFTAAVEISKSFRTGDVRVDVGFGNLARVASIYERLGRSDDARRVLSTIDAVATHRGDPAHRALRVRERYERLVTMPLGARLMPPELMRPRGDAPYDHLIRRTAHTFDVDPALVKAVVAAESNFEPRAVSRVGAQGLMQLMPRTARAMGVRRPFAPSENIRGGVRYLRSLLDRFDTLDHALAAYNAGPEAVVRYGGIPPYPETEAYVTRVLSHYRRYQTTFNQ